MARRKRGPDLSREAGDVHAAATVGVVGQGGRHRLSRAWEGEPR